MQDARPNGRRRDALVAGRYLLPLAGHGGRVGVEGHVLHGEGFRRGIGVRALHLVGLVVGRAVGRGVLLNLLLLVILLVVLLLIRLLLQILLLFTVLLLLLLLTVLFVL